MTLDNTLVFLIKRCETNCHAKCCEIEAFNFSPIHIASLLELWHGSFKVQEISGQLAELRQSYGTASETREGVTIDEMNHTFTAEKLDLFIEEITINLKVALDLIEQSDARRAPLPDYSGG